MRRLHILLVLPLILASCGELDPKGLTDAATDAFGARNYRTSLTKFEQALAGMDASHAQYLRAAIGRCMALAHVDPAKGKDEFLKLATAEKARLGIADVQFIVDEFVKVGEIQLATEIVVGAQALFPESAALQTLGDSVLAAALKVGDTRSSRQLEGLGYVGGARTAVPVTNRTDGCEAFRDKLFRSVKDTVVGLGQEGPVLGRSTIKFGKGRMEVQTADAYESISFTCSNGDLVASLGGQELRGHYDPSRRILTLNGTEYERVD